MYEHFYSPAAKQALEELQKARKTFPPMQSAHEGWAVLYEEVCELWDEVRNNKGDETEYKTRMFKEAQQVAAMAIAFMAEVCL